MTISNDIKTKLAESREFREELVAAIVKRAFPLQVKTIRKARRMSQKELAEEAKIDQGVVSRAENPNYGNLTFNTALRVSAGLDLGFIPLIVPFSRFVEWAEEITEGFTDLPSFEEEMGAGAMGAQQEAGMREVATLADAPVRGGGQTLVTGAEAAERALAGQKAEAPSFALRKEPQGDYVYKPQGDYVYAANGGAPR